MQTLVERQHTFDIHNGQYEVDSVLEYKRFNFQTNQNKQRIETVIVKVSKQVVILTVYICKTVLKNIKLNKFLLF